MTDHADYFAYLQGRSHLGWLYRQFFLYPRLTRRLSGRVLDVGCGIGDFLKFRPGTVGVDVNAHTVDWCRRQGLDCRLMDADRLPFADGSFDAVVLDNVLEHLAEPQPLLAEIRRVLVPGGRLLIGVPGPRGYACDADHKVFYDAADLERVLGEAGFPRRLIFHAPWKSAWLAARLPQYCLYGVFERA